MSTKLGKVLKIKRPKIHFQSLKNGQNLNKIEGSFTMDGRNADPY